MRQFDHLIKDIAAGRTIGWVNKYRRRQLQPQHMINEDIEDDTLKGELLQTNVPYIVRDKLE